MEKEQNKMAIIRHSISHLMSMAVQELYPQVGLGVGPSIENGFYQDYGLPETIAPDILPKLEKRIRELIKQNIKFEQRDVDFAQAYEFYKHDPYKTGFIDDLKAAGEKKVSFYKSDWFDNLCAGPHVGSTKEINPEAFKLTKIAGAYWRGDEKNTMLTRIYGVAFETKDELNDYLKRVEEAEKRDHRKLGKELDLFVFSDLVGQGLPLFTPKGTIIIDELKKHIETVCRQYGFEKVMTPHLAKIDLYELSGHAKKFSEELFHVTSQRKHQFVLKPVQCPHQTQIYASRMRSYKDLPIRYMESEKQYRAEKTGEVGGLNRVYAITVEDGHTFCRPDQVKNEIINMVNIIKDFYSALGLWGNHWISLSVRDYANPEKYIGDAQDWDLCEKMLQEVSDEMGLSAKRCEGEAALYGPKLDFMFKDALGKEIQIPTVQLDFATPKRFNLVYTNAQGKEENPVMVHRAVLGSYERFLVLLIEHFAGVFPTWLAPEQVWVLSISEKHVEYANKVTEQLRAAGIRVLARNENESIGKKIRAGEKQKIPYLLVVGDKEIEAAAVAVRQRGQGDLGAMNTEEFIEKITKEIKERV